MKTSINFTGSKKSVTTESASESARESFHGVNPKTRQNLSPAYQEASRNVCDSAVDDALEAFEEYRIKTPGQIAEFLNAIASELNAVSEELIARAHLETALSYPRLQGELARTVGQLNMFAQVVRSGTWMGANIDTAIRDRVPNPKPDIRRVMIPIGPILVFSASNFPLAFSVAGGDTASALAAGNTVVVKAHPGHPGTSDLAILAIRSAISKCKMPEATVSLIHATKIEMSQHLVSHPKIRAVGFTGSLVAGRAIYNVAAARPEPIPVFAEMGSLNPVLILPEVMECSGVTLAEKFVQSMTLGVGQFCTKPGVLIVQKSNALQRFMAMIAAQIRQTTPGTMLYAGLCDRFEAGIQELKKSGSVSEIARSQTPANAERGEVASVLFNVEACEFVRNKQLREEVFGPVSITVICNDLTEMTQVMNSLEGQLTATIHGTHDEIEKNRALVDLLCQKAGRVVFNSFPTGVEVCSSMVHGGPYPATTDARSTSVGAAAMDRWLRPVCYQDCPEHVLPQALRNINELKIWRTINGDLTQESIQ